MKFLDEVNILLKAGNGGDGCVSFRREKFIPYGGPDGGNGGNGGNIYIVSVNYINSFIDYRYKRIFQSENGFKGRSKVRTGKSGSDMCIFVPIGTRVFLYNTSDLLFDFIYHNQKFLIVKGGLGGFGNFYFKSSTNRVPYIFTYGKLGESIKINLQLFLISDIGLVGLPNSGKSSFFNLTSYSNSKVSNYPFTTIVPFLGVIHINRMNFFILSDIPGIIKGSYYGSGVGINFLRHIDRCKILLFFIDLSILDKFLIFNNFNILLIELILYKRLLLCKNFFIIFNKFDLCYRKNNSLFFIQNIFSYFNLICDYYVISSLNYMSVKLLKIDLINYLIEFN